MKISSGALRFCVSKLYLNINNIDSFASLLFSILTLVLFWDQIEKDNFVSAKCA